MVKLTETSNQDVSALVDDEFVGDSEVRLEGIGGNRESWETWQRYHLVRDVMQQDYTSSLDTDFASRVSRQIEMVELSDEVSEQNVVQPGAYAKPGRSRRKMNIPMLGLGMAASVALASLIGFQYFGAQDNPSPLNSQLSVASSGADAIVVADAASDTSKNGLLPAEFMDVSGTRWRPAIESPRDKQIEQRLNSLLTNHLEQAAMGKVHGILSHSRVVSYDLPANNEGN